MKRFADQGGNNTVNWLYNDYRTIQASSCLEALEISFLLRTMGLNYGSAFLKVQGGLGREQGKIRENRSGKWGIWFGVFIYQYHGYYFGIFLLLTASLCRPRRFNPSLASSRHVVSEANFPISHSHLKFFLFTSKPCMRQRCRMSNILSFIVAQKQVINARFVNNCSSMNVKPFRLNDSARLKMFHADIKGRHELCSRVIFTAS